MFEAQYLFHGDAVFSPWMSRQADNMIATVDLIDDSGSSGDIVIEVYQKNSEQTGDGGAHPNEDGTSGSPTQLTTSAVDQKSETFANVMELVRYRISTSATSSGERFLFRMLPPVWFDHV